MNITPAVSALIDLALEEDLGRGDVTSWVLLDGQDPSVAGVILAKAPLTVFGLAVVAEVFRRVVPAAECRAIVEDGAVVTPGTTVVTLTGPATGILQAERVALNFLQRLSGVATLSARFAAEVAGTGARVVDTRKTTPGYRALEKAAVRAGGCGNHRADLGSGILLKDNHIVAAGGVSAAVTRAIARAPHGLRIEVEVTTPAELDQALAAGAEVVLLDNMTPEQVASCAATAHQKGVTVEVSGGVTLSNVRAYALAGADLISVGALTHSAPAVDLSLELTGA